MRVERRAAPSVRMVYLSPVLALVATLVSGMAIFALLGQPPAAVMYAFFVAPVRDLYGVSELLLKATPLLLCAAGLSLCFRARVWNIGAEGQFLLGTLGGGVVALACNDLDTGFGWAILAAVLAGMLAGAAWAALVALLRDRFACSEILTSIMLNYVALQLLLWAVNGPLKDPNGFNFPESALLVEEILLPTLHPDYRVHIGLLATLFAIGALWLLMTRTLLGFRIRVFGESAAAAGYAGFSARAILWFVLATCGALAGLAGAFEVLGPVGQVTPHLSMGYGFSAIIVVFLGRNHPFGIVLAGLLFALTFIGGENLQIEFGLPRSITQMFQGLLLFYLLAADFLIEHRLRLPGAAAAGA